MRLWAVCVVAACWTAPPPRSPAPPEPAAVTVRPRPARHPAQTQLDDAMIAMTELTDRMCACPDKACADAVTKDHKFILVDLKSSNGTFVNGRRITAPVVVRETDTIVIGDYTLAVESELEPTLIERPTPYLPADDAEAKLLDEIADDASRLVY